MAFLLVQHLDPVHESVLAQLLTKHTALPVNQVTHGESLAIDHVYVIAPNTVFTIASGTFQVTVRVHEEPHTPIDILFQSLASELEHRAIGVILSGGGSDGTRGLAAIKEAGGIALAQDLASAKFSSMPRSAIDSGAVDFIAPPGEIARELMRVARHPYLKPSGHAAAPDTELPNEAAALSDEQQLKALFRLLHNASGIDFSHYKRSTIQRRLARRMALDHVDVPLANYVKRLQEDPGEQQALVQDLLIRVTSFFRDPAVFDALTQTVFPALLHNRPSGDPLRIWVPGCATGEEVYSLAICVLESLGEAAQATQIQIFGTDVNAVAIERARAGRYLHTISAEVSAARLQRFFVKLDDHYQIAKSVRDRCVFATQNLSRDPPFSRVDLVSCRNLLIYLDQTLQRRALSLFHYALKPNGFLLLGASESVGQGAELFELVDKRHHIFSRRSVTAHTAATFQGQPARSSRPSEAGVAGSPPPPGGLPEEAVLRREVDRALARYGPAGVVVEENLNILEFRGDTAPYLELPVGTATLNLQRLARPGLLLALAPAIKEARQNGTPVRREAVRVGGRDGPIDVHFEVVPLPAREGESPCQLIMFQPVAAKRVPDPGRGLWKRWFGAGREASRRTSPADAQQHDDELMRITRELEETRTFLRITIEEHEAVKEELKSAHEEVLSANEEFQSTNEELETAKEELQSINEELATTNDELRSRNRELSNSNEALTDARDYADLIIETVRDPLLVLDCDLRVMRANRAFYDTFKSTIENTEAHRIYDIDGGVWDTPSLREELNAILPADAVFHDFTVTHAFPRVGEKTLLLNARRLPPNRQRPEMILLAMEDITDRHAAAEALLRSESRFRALADAGVIGMVLHSDEQGRIIEANQAFLGMLGYTHEDLHDGLLRWDRLTPPEYRQRDLEGITEANQRGACTPYEKEYIRKDGRRVPVLIGYAPVEGEPNNYVAFVLDLTQRHALEEDLRRRSEELQLGARRKDEFLAMLAHELRNPLAPIAAAVEILQRADSNEATLQWGPAVIKRQVEHLTRIVDDLLDVSRLTQGKIVLHNSILTVRQIVDHALEVSRPWIDGRKQRLTIALPAEPLYVEGDIIRLSQVIANLLGNSAKYTDEGGEIALMVQRRDDGIAISVRDDGMGISANVLPHVFELFMQSERALARAQGGLGIGLTLVRQLVEQHGGHVAAKSEGLGKGSEFTVWLPAAYDTPAEAAAATAQRSLDNSGYKRRILVVDDNFDANESLSLLLSMVGHDVRSAAEGNAALEIAKEFKPGLVLLDLGMPGMDGYEVARRLRAGAGADQPVLVALTGYGDPEVRKLTQEAGFDRHWVKPVNFDALATLLASLPQGAS